MHILFLYQGRLETHAFLWDTITMESLLVYDINDRQSKYYRHSFLFIQNNIYLGNYAIQVLLGSNQMPNNLIPQNAKTGFIFKEIDIHDEISEISGQKLHLNLSGFLAILLKKIFFDASYINNYRPIDEIFYLTDKKSYNILNRKISIISSLNIKTTPELINNFTAKYFNPPITSAAKNDIVVFWKEENALIFLNPGHPEYKESPMIFEHKGFKKQLFKIFQEKANIQFPVSFIDLLKWEETISQVLLRLSYSNRAGSFMVDIEVAGEVYFVQFNTEDIQKVIYNSFEDLVILLRTLLPDEKKQSSKIEITAEFFNNHFLEQSIISILSKYEISSEILFCSIDNFKNILLRNNSGFELLNVSAAAVNQGNNLLNNSFYMSYFNPEKDKLDLDCIFHMNMELPCTEVRIVKTRFLYQNRIYFEIYEKPSSQSENYFASIEAGFNENDSAETEIVLLLTFKIGIDRVLACQINDQHTGKKINTNIIYAENGSYTELRQFEIVKNLKIMNNYMDKRRETQLGIF